MSKAEEILNSSRVVAVVGLSSKTDRPSYRVASYLKEQGYKIVPVNPEAKEIIENTKEVYPSSIVTGMAANAVFGSPRMGAIFGGMLLSGKRAAEITWDVLSKK